MIGHILGGRYEILERIGGGGMALVYKAFDKLLNRKVAVKVLRQQFVNDEDFIRRFRREAQAAASLSHPNVVSIYDVGQENDTHYIVMEYVEGKTLNEMIKERAPLQVEEAVHIAAQICDALDHAHHNQIIHRDIKPHNILIGKNGRVKVTDFGIARAATSSDITQTGSVIGSVHYFSPEHAKGVAQGAKSDIYSLGIVMYQMLTGRLPFHGESPISVALKHLQEDVEEPRKVNPMIPQSVENIILRAMRKKEEERYESAKAMLHDLNTCLLPERMNEKKIRFIAENAGDEEETRVMPAIGLKTAPQSGNAKRSENRHNLPGAEAAVERRSWLKPTVWSVVIICLLLAMWLAVQYVLGKIRVPDVTVPNVVGDTIEQAKQKLTDAKLTIGPIDYQFSDTVPKDNVMEQEKSGTVKEGASIGLVVSKGVELDLMQNYIGLRWDEVVNDLSAKYGDDHIEKREVESDEPAGEIIDQSPQPNEEFDPKKINLSFTVSKGQGTFPMPNLIGKNKEEAMAEILKNDLVADEANFIYEKSYFPANTVIKQFPYEPGQPAEKGKKIVLTISSGFLDDAIELPKDIPVSPTAPGEKTAIKITVSDAQGSRDLIAEDITEDKHYTVMVIVSKTTNASITVLRNGTIAEIYSVTYSDAQKMLDSGDETGGPVPENLPAQEQNPDEGAAE